MDDEVFLVVRFCEFDSQAAGLGTSAVCVTVISRVCVKMRRKCDFFWDNQRTYF